MMPYPRYLPSANAHFDGFILLDSVEAGLTTPSPSRSPIIYFQVSAGMQPHPVYALDRLAIVIYSYCKAAHVLDHDTQMQAYFSCAWVSTAISSNLIATHVEWHVSTRMRTAAQKFIDDIDSSNPSWVWPKTEIRLPGQGRS